MEEILKKIQAILDEANATLVVQHTIQVVPKKEEVKEEK